MFSFKSFIVIFFKFFRCIIHVFLLGLFFRCIFNFLDFFNILESLFFIIFLTELKNSYFLNDYPAYHKNGILSYFHENKSIYKKYFNGLFFKDNKYSNLLRANVGNFNRWVNVESNIFDRCRRKIYWIFLEGRKDYYGSYENYKLHWNPNVDLSKELKQWFNLNKKTLKWVINRRNVNK